MRKGKYPKVFKIEVVKASIQSDKTIAEVAEENCIGESTLFLWRKELLDEIEESLEKNKQINYKKMYEEIREKYRILKNKFNALQKSYDKLIKIANKFMQEVKLKKENT